MRQRGSWWKVRMMVASGALLLLFILSIPIASAAPYRQTKGHVGVQGTPTVDPTVTVLEKQQLSLEVDQLQHNFENYMWNNLTLLLSTIILVVGGTIGFWRWLVERQNDAEKRSEERFQEVLESIGDEKVERQVAGAIMLHSFLQPRYERFYKQIFELAAANLELHHLLPLLHQNSFLEEEKQREVNKTTQ